MFNPPMTRKEVDKQLSTYQKINYNQFRWWRMYQPKNKPLDNRKPLRERIMNGDFEFSHYYLQALWVEYDLNDLQIECKDDSGVFVERGAVMRARRKRLYEDYERDEKEKLRELRKCLHQSFKITKQQLEEVMEGFGGTTLELYFHLDDKYKIINQISPLLRKRRGRPKKL